MLRGWCGHKSFFSWPWMASLACVAGRRVLLPDVGSSRSYPLDPEQHYPLQILDVGVYVESVTMWTWMEVIASDHPNHHDVDWVFAFHQYEYKYVVRLAPKHSESFRRECHAIKHPIFKFLKEWMASWCCFLHGQCSTDSCLLYNGQNFKQAKCKARN